MTDGWTLIRLDEVESTNDLARKLALDPDDSPALPLVLRADRQTRGRGRGSNSWWSDPGSLTFSVLLDPLAVGLEDRHTPLCSLATAVAVIETVRPILDRGDLGLRWPNDVEVDGRKIAGILPERINGPRGPRLIIGIGLNVRTDLGEGPEEVRRMAASLQDFVGSPFSAEDQDLILTLLLDQLDAHLMALAHDDPGLSRHWAALDQLRDAPVRVDLGGEVVEGIGAGIRPDGGLLIRTEASVRVVHGGRVLRNES
jgi:BirA family biotin operon repressor/biotin-[acetyl-CoA-carboxylase] ligase